MIAHKVIDIVSRACHYYERRFPKDETIDLWTEKVKGIPDEAAQYIEDHICDQDILPKNVPGYMWILYNAWKNAHPENNQSQMFRYCPDCIDGIIWAAKKNEVGTIYTSIFRCPACKQNHVQAYPIGRKSTLIADGYEIRTPKGSNLSAEEKEKVISDQKKLGIRSSLITDKRAVCYDTPF